MTETAFMNTGRSLSKYVEFKDKDKPVEVRLSNIMAAKGMRITRVK
jgi:hypothetical protein